MTLLSLERIEKIFGGLRAIGGVSLEVGEKQIFGLIGPNGAGKTTLFNVVTGVYAPDGGRVMFDGVAISGMKPADVALRGIARTFQNIRLFRSMSVAQNVMVAGHKLARAGLASRIFRGKRFAHEERELRRRTDQLLDLFKLKELAQSSAESLPYGMQRRLEIARALMLEPKLVLLDEPAAGMNSGEAHELKSQIRFLRDDLGLTIVLVEHNMSVVMGVCERVHVLDHGETIAEGPPQEIKTNAKVLAAYLGEESAEQALQSLEDLAGDVKGGEP
jgi:branched-chain amino acid transport system ATP-binding protein